MCSGGTQEKGKRFHLKRGKRKLGKEEQRKTKTKNL
jgi:hypothetical protein